MRGELTAAQIEQLVSRSNQRSGGGRSGSGKRVNTKTRDVQTWFSLMHTLLNEDTQELASCENPNCQDSRTKGIMVAKVEGKYMCRFCFLGGWLLTNDDQLSMDDE